MVKRIVLSRARLLALPDNSPVAQVVAGTQAVTGETWLNHAAAITAELGITVDFPCASLAEGARSTAEARRKAVQRWKKDVVMPAIRAQEQQWFLHQLAELNNEGLIPYRELLLVREPLTAGARWAPWLKRRGTSNNQP